MRFKTKVKLFRFFNENDERMDTLLTQFFDGGTDLFQAGKYSEMFNKQMSQYV